jgi:hypothetical protein
MRSVEELIKETVDELNSVHEGNAKTCIRNIITAIVYKQKIIKDAQEEIKKLQVALKEVSVEQVPSNFLI